MTSGCNAGWSHFVSAAESAGGPCPTWEQAERPKAELCPAQSGSTPEGDRLPKASVSPDHMGVGRVVGAPVVEAAQRDRQVQVGVSSAAPRILVVELAPGVRPVTALGRALVVRRGEGYPLRFSEEAM